MRSRATTFVVPPYNGHFFPHEAFPPWRSLRPVFDVIGGALRRSATRAPLRHLEVPLVQASKQIVAVAGGDLPPVQWHRRARVAMERLERMKRASGVYLKSKMLTTAEAQKIVDAVDETIESLVAEVARVSLPDENRLAE
jgi:hypothetical protein